MASHEATKFLAPKPKSGGSIAQTGYVFACSNSTLHECQTKRLFGSPDRDFGQMQNCILPSTQLFLFNVESYRLLGPFMPVGTPGSGIVQDAFNGKFNAQIRVKPRETGLRAAMLDKRLPAGPKSGKDLDMIQAQLERGNLLDPSLQQAWGIASSADDSPPALNQSGNSQVAPKRLVAKPVQMPPRGAESHDTSGNPAIPANVKVVPAKRLNSRRVKSLQITAASAKSPPKGYVFVCSTATQQECMSLRLFGAPDWELEQMKQFVTPSMQLFLLNIQTSTLFGIFKAAGTPDRALLPNAFGNKFNSQVRVGLLDMELRQVKLQRRVAAGPKSAYEVEDLRTQLQSGEALESQLYDAWCASDEVAQPPQKRLRTSPASSSSGSSKGDVLCNKKEEDQLLEPAHKKQRRDDNPPSAGYMFLCNNATQPECEKLKLFGAPKSELSRMQKCIDLGTPLLLFNTQSSKITGPFVAASLPSLSIIPGAFGGKYTAHVQATLSDSPLCEANLKQRLLTKAGAKTTQEWEKLSELLADGGPADIKTHEIWLENAQAEASPEDSQLPEATANSQDDAANAESSPLAEAVEDDINPQPEEESASNQAVEDPYGCEIAKTAEDANELQMEDGSLAPESGTSPEVDTLLQRVDEFEERAKKVMKDSAGVPTQTTGGYLFMCSSSTQRECETLGVLAAPESELGQMKQSILAGTPLFLLNFQTLELLGAFAAAGPPDRALVPGAFGGRYNAQVFAVVSETELRHVKVERRLPSGPKSPSEVEALQAQLEHGSLADSNSQEAWCAAAEKRRAAMTTSIDSSVSESVLQRPLTPGILQMLSPEARKELEGDLQTLVQGSGVIAEIQSAADKDSDSIVLCGDREVVASLQGEFEEILNFYGIVEA